MAGKTGKIPPDVDSCDVCGRKVQITSNCVNCKEYLCGNCTVAHRGSKLTKQHNIIDLYVNVKHKVEYCLDHPSEEIQMYCSQCSDVVCKLCIITTHNAHTFSDIRGVANTKREEIAASMSVIKDKYLVELLNKITEMEEKIKENERQGENRVKQIKQRVNDLHKQLDDIQNKRLTESKQREHHCKCILTNTKAEINEHIGYLKDILSENERKVKTGSDAEVLRSAKKLSNLDWDCEIKMKVAQKQEAELTNYIFDSGAVLQQILEDGVGYLREDGSEIELSSDIDREGHSLRLTSEKTCLIDVSEMDMLTKLLTVYEQQDFCQHQHSVMVDFSVKLSELLQKNLTPALCRDVAIGGKAVTLHLTLGDFLHFSGCFSESENVYNNCIKCLSGTDDTPLTLGERFQCNVKLMNIQIENCCYGDAETTSSKAFPLLQILHDQGVPVNSAALCAQKAGLLGVKSKYNEALEFCDRAMKQLSEALPSETIVDVLLECMKVCALTDDLKRASTLVTFVTQFARDKFGERHPKYAHVLQEYGWYLLKVDSLKEAVDAYQTSLDIRRSVFGPVNVWVANTHEGLAYALYVRDYTVANFDEAMQHATTAIEILENLLPNDHMLLCSANRAKALIEEEIALDSDSQETKTKLLCEAETLHLKSLQISKKALGEKSIQTANHYGNLARLYQSMKKFKEAENMLLTSIRTYEKLLGTDCAELALKLGHLASLYNYNTKQYDKAERLYQRSIALVVKTYGENYSGLNYDYEGIINVYKAKGDSKKQKQYADILHRWKNNQTKTKDKKLTEDTTKDVQSIVQKYFQFTKA